LYDTSFGTISRAELSDHRIIRSRSSDLLKVLLKLTKLRLILKYFFLGELALAVLRQLEAIEDVLPCLVDGPILLTPCLHHFTNSLMVFANEPLTLHVSEQSVELGDDLLIRRYG